MHGTRPPSSIGPSMQRLARHPPSSLYRTLQPHWAATSPKRLKSWHALCSMARIALHGTRISISPSVMVGSEDKSSSSIKYQLNPYRGWPCAQLLRIIRQPKQATRSQGSNDTRETAKYPHISTSQLMTLNSRTATLTTVPGFQKSMRIYSFSSG
jgi:hypothetical protein